MHISFDFDKQEFFEFIWRYERLVEERKRENERASKEQGRNNLMNGSQFNGV
jgi:hypothetical protein